MSCVARFDNDINLSCIMQFIFEARQGVSKQLIVQGLWIAGCLLNKIASPTLPTLPEMMLLAEAVDGEIIEFSNEDTINKLLDELEKVTNVQLDINTGATVVLAGESTTQGWEVIVPIILELILQLLKNRKS